MTTDWEWRVGTLNGFGECAWQQMGDVIRRPTILMPTPAGGLGFLTPVSLQIADGTPPTMQFKATGLVCASQPMKKELIADLERHWSGSRLIIGRNGGDGMGPRRMG